MPSLRSNLCQIEASMDFLFFQFKFKVSKLLPDDNIEADQIGFLKKDQLCFFVDICPIPVLQLCKLKKITVNSNQLVQLVINPREKNHCWLGHLSGVILRDRRSYERKTDNEHSQSGQSHHHRILFIFLTEKLGGKCKKLKKKN